MDLSSLLYDHRLVDAYQNSTDILQSTIFTQQYVYTEMLDLLICTWLLFCALFETHCFHSVSFESFLPFFFSLDRYVERVLANERDRMKCCSIEYSHPKQSSQAFVYGGILLAGFLVYSLVIFFSSPVR